MHSARVISADWMGEMPDQDAGAEPVIRVTTDLPAGQDNAFYMDVADKDGRQIKLPLANQPAGAPIDPEAINFGDLIEFDRFLLSLPPQTEVRWKGRRVRQRGYSFDWLAERS